MNASVEQAGPLRGDPQAVRNHLRALSQAYLAIADAEGFLEGVQSVVLSGNETDLRTLSWPADMPQFEGGDCFPIFEQVAQMWNFEAKVWRWVKPHGLLHERILYYQVKNIDEVRIYLPNWEQPPPPTFGPIPNGMVFVSLLVEAGFVEVIDDGTIALEIGQVDQFRGWFCEKITGGGGL